MDAGNVKGARILGEALAERAISKGLTKVVFDRAGYDTHGVPIESKVEQKLGFKTKQDIENRISAIIKSFKG